jgi:hypothetical protein
MKQKQQKIIVGYWDDSEGTGNSFVPHEKQPDDPITQMAEMLTWAREALKDEPGEYVFVREIPGVLKVQRENRTVVKFEE